MHFESLLSSADGLAAVPGFGRLRPTLDPTTLLVSASTVAGQETLYLHGACNASIAVAVTGEDAR